MTGRATAQHSRVNDLFVQFLLYVAMADRAQFGVVPYCHCFVVRFMRVVAYGAVSCRGWAVDIRLGGPVGMARYAKLL